MKGSVSPRKQCDDEGFEIHTESLGGGGQSGLRRASRLTPEGLEEQAAVKCYNDEHRSRAAIEELALRLLGQDPSVPGVVQLIGVKRDPQGRAVGLYLEFIEGRNLHDILKQGSVPWNRLKSWIEQLFEIVHAVHERDVLHRDIKPENIMVVSDGNGERVVLLDFGLARVLGTDRETLPGMIIGTPLYMPPEGVNLKETGGNLPDAPSLDVYALGIVLWEALTGLPFRPPCKSSAELYLNVSTDLGLESCARRGLVARRFRDCPAGRRLERLIGEMLSHKPEERPSLEEIIARFAWLDHAALSVHDNMAKACAYLEETPTVRDLAQVPVPAPVLPAKLSLRWKLIMTIVGFIFLVLGILLTVLCFKRH